MKEYKKSTTSERRSVYNLNFKLLFYMKTLIHLETSKWAATSPVTLCMLTGPLIFFAMAGVGIAPRDTEYGMGRLSFCRTWTSALHVPSSLSRKDWRRQIYATESAVYLSNTNVISSTSKLLPNTQSCFTADKKEEKKKRNY
jgi:hypothetical protein